MIEGSEPILDVARTRANHFSSHDRAVSIQKEKVIDPMAAVGEDTAS
jgi:hypothetical protein